MFSLILVYMCKSFLTRFVMCTRAHRKKCQCCVHVSVSALCVCEHVCVCERERILFFEIFDMSMYLPPNEKSYGFI